MDGGLILTCVLSLVFIVMGIVLLSGHGSWMIAGYNTMSKEEKGKIDGVALCKFMGKIILPVGITMPSLFIGDMLDTKWFAIGFGVLTVGLVVFAVVYANTGNRFRI